MAEGPKTEMKAQVYKDPRPAEHFTRFHDAHAREAARTGCTRLVRLVLTPYLLLFFRTRAIDSDKVPADGPVIVAPNHFSFLDHFFVAVYLRRKVQFMAKSQLFKGPIEFVYYNGGVFPVRRGHRDEEAFKTAHAVLARGGIVVMYCEGGRSRTGELGRAQAGHRAAGAGVRRAGGARGARGLRARARLEAAPVPQGHGAVRRADPVRAGRGPHRASSRRPPRSRSSPASAGCGRGCARTAAAPP